jgi:hypothetical protein
MYLTEQYVHLFDLTNVHVFSINKMYMYLTEKNVHIFDI